MSYGWEGKYQSELEYLLSDEGEQEAVKQSLAALQKLNPKFNSQAAIPAHDFKHTSPSVRSDKRRGSEDTIESEAEEIFAHDSKTLPFLRAAHSVKAELESQQASLLIPDPAEHKAFVVSFNVYKDQAAFLEVHKPAMPSMLPDAEVMVMKSALKTSGIKPVAKHVRFAMINEIKGPTLDDQPNLDERLSRTINPWEIFKTEKNLVLAWVLEGERLRLGELPTEDAKLSKSNRIVDSAELHDRKDFIHYLDSADVDAGYKESPRPFQSSLSNLHRVTVAKHRSIPEDYEIAKWEKLERANTSFQLICLEKKVAWALPAWLEVYRLANLTSLGARSDEGFFEFGFDDEQELSKEEYDEICERCGFLPPSSIFAPASSVPIAANDSVKEPAV